MCGMILLVDQAFQFAQWMREGGSGPGPLRLPGKSIHTKVIFGRVKEEALRGQGPMLGDRGWGRHQGEADHALGVVALACEAFATMGT